MVTRHDVLKHIKDNKRNFPVNFQLFKQLPKSKSKKASKGVMVNVEKFQTTMILKDDFFKNISRMI